jgi:hypothetical protein
MASRREHPGRAGRLEPIALAANIGIPLGAFALAALLAELAGAANLGVSLGVGQVAFALAATYVLLRR